MISKLITTPHLGEANVAGRTGEKNAETNGEKNAMLRTR